MPSLAHLRLVPLPVDFFTAHPVKGAPFALSKPAQRLLAASSSQAAMQRPVAAASRRPKRRDMSPGVTARQGPTHRRLVAHPCPAKRPTAAGLVVHKGPQAWGNQIVVSLGWLKPRCFCVPNPLT